MKRELPPVVALLFRECADTVKSSAELAKKLRERGLLRELKLQAQYAQSNWPYVDLAAARSGGRFVVTPADSLNPMIKSVKCPSPACRTKLAREFVRSVGLYADEVILPDVVSGRLLTDSSPRELAEDIYADVQVLTELKPLIDAGYLQFGSPSHHFCPGCNSALDEVGDVSPIRALALDLASEVIVEALRRDEKGRPYVECRFPAFDEFGHALTRVRLSIKQAAVFKSLIPSGKTSKLPEQLVPFFREHVEYDLKILSQGLTGEVLSAQKTGAVLAGASGLERMILRSLEQSSTRLRELSEWEVTRTLQLPWIRELSASEIVQLKDEARDALPRLRALLARRLATQGTSPEAMKVVGLELSEEAAQVEAELAASKAASTRRIRIATGAAGLGFVLYEAITADPAGATLTATAIASLIGFLNALHPQAQKEN